MLAAIEVGRRLLEALADLGDDGVELAATAVAALLIGELVDADLARQVIGQRRPPAAAFVASLMPFDGMAALARIGVCPGFSGFSVSNKPSMAQT
jgi:hypothetical protein